MVILFPSNPISPKAVDGAFGHEAHAAKEAGFKIGRIDLEVILGGEVRIQGVPDDEPVEYRGWLMKPSQYEAMHAALGGRLVTTPEQYVTAYELPRWYRALSSTGLPSSTLTPESLWLAPEFDLTKLDDIATLVSVAFGQSEDIKRRRQELNEWREKNAGVYVQDPIDLLELPGTHAVMVKDYVKSAKHRWFDACYIHHADDAVEVKRIVKNFLDTVSDGLVGSLVFRKFEHFKRIGTHSKINLPLVNEWRAFMSKGKVFYLAPYWAEGTPGVRPEEHVIEALAAGLSDLALVAVDVAECVDGRWMIVEINPGGAAGVPEGGDTQVFYTALKKTLT